MEEKMHKQLTIALVAHDRRKADMVDWATYNATTLSQHKIICTGTTGGLIQKAFNEKGIQASITRVNSGPMGGDAGVDRVAADGSGPSQTGFPRPRSGGLH